MNRTRAAGLAAAAVIATAAIFFFLRRETFPEPSPVAAENAPAATADNGRRSISIHELASPSVSPSEKIRRVYTLVQNCRQVLRNRGGPPLDSNREFTAALTGNNALKIRFLPLEHPSISADGELLDAWDTPYFFHVLSADSLEVRSAGPDRISFNADDIVFPPPRPGDSIQGVIRPNSKTP